MSASLNPVVQCGQCGESLDESSSLPSESRQPCPNCGSLTRRFGVALSATLTMKSELRLKAKSPGEKKPFMEQKIGDSYSWARDRWMDFVMVIDRRNDRYRKRVVDPETGEVLRDVDEPLTEHTGRGSARKPKS
jgi:hypothetical protein